MQRKAAAGRLSRPKPFSHESRTKLGPRSAAGRGQRGVGTPQRATPATPFPAQLHTKVHCCQANPPGPQEMGSRNLRSGAMVRWRTDGIQVEGTCTPQRGRLCTGRWSAGEGTARQCGMFGSGTKAKAVVIIVHLVLVGTVQFSKISLPATVKLQEPFPWPPLRRRIKPWQ